MLGKEKYPSYTTLQREGHVYNKIMQNSHFFTDIELEHARVFIEKLRREG